MRLLGDLVLVEHHGEAAERGGLERVDADVEERRVHRLDHVRPGEAQHLVAALQRRAPEVVGPEVETLHERAERTIEDDDALVDRIEVGLPHGRARYRWAGPGQGAFGPPPYTHAADLKERGLHELAEHHRRPNPAEGR
jgi:hypothetical protein